MSANESRHDERELLPEGDTERFINIAQLRKRVNKSSVTSNSTVSELEQVANADLFGQAVAFAPRAATSDLQPAWRRIALACLVLLAIATGGRALFNATSVPAKSPAISSNARNSEPIESMRVGQRVLTAPSDASCSGTGTTNVDVKTWRRLQLRAENRWEDGTLDVIEAETLQPPEWVDAHAAQPGAVVPLPLDLQEMGLSKSLMARVIVNEPCPTLSKGKGCVVLTTVNHLNNDVWEVSVLNENGQAQAIRPTGLHKFYSGSRDEWVSAKELKSGEHLQGVSGVVVVQSTARLPGIHRVYNMTVESEHVYRVSPFGVLVHNNGCSVLGTWGHDPATGVSFRPGIYDASTGNVHLGSGLNGHSPAATAAGLNNVPTTQLSGFNVMQQGNNIYYNSGAGWFPRPLTAAEHVMVTSALQSEFGMPVVQGTPPGVGSISRPGGVIRPAP